jgi:ubiquinone/menaquinone biosynthesis C-methylase UbiE
LNSHQPRGQDQPDHHTWSAHGHGMKQPRLYELTSNLAFLGRRRAVHDQILTLSGVKPGDHVLDIGCGPGYLTRRASKRVGPTGRVDGVDPSPEALAHAARRTGNNVRLRPAAANHLPFEDATFDVVLSMLALHHIGPERLPASLNEIYRVLKPRGAVVVADFIADPDDPPGSQPRRRHQPVTALMTALDDAGLTTTGQGTHSHGIRYVSATK